MVILVVLLAAAFFVGAASAVSATATVKISNDNAETVTFADGETIHVNITVATAITDKVNVTYGTATQQIVPTVTGAEVTFIATYGITFISYKKDASTSTDTILSFTPASPTTITVAAPEGYRVVSSGGDAFVYEHIIVAGATGELTKHSKGNNPAALNQIFGNGGEFYLTESAVNSQYGAYYYAGSPKDNVDTFIYIWYPELSLQAELTTGC